MEDKRYYTTVQSIWYRNQNKQNDYHFHFILLGNVLIGWVSSTSAYVGLYRREQAAVALSTLSQSDTYTITTHSKRQEQLQGVKTVPLSLKPKRTPEITKTNPPKKKRKSSISKRSIEPIEEAVEETSITPVKNKKLKNEPAAVIPVLEDSGRKRRVSKTFQEDNSWD